MKSKPRHQTDVTPEGNLHEALLHDVLGYQLVQASIIADALFLRHVGEVFNLRPIEYTILTLIVENPGGSLVRLARALNVTPPHISAWIERLETRGLVLREKSSADRRTHVLVATEEGQDLSRKATSRILAAEAEALDELSTGERKILIELLRKVAGNRAISRTSRAPPLP